MNYVRMVLDIIISIVISGVVIFGLLMTIDLVKGKYLGGDDESDKNNSGGSTDYIIMTSLM